MNIAELLESTRQMGKYQLPYSRIHRAHRGLERLYNAVWPELAKALLVPARNLKLECWSAEKGIFKIKISNPKTEVDMIELMGPKALKNILEKCGFQNVHAHLISSGWSKATPSGKQFQVVEIAFSTEYPELWIKYDEQTYGTQV